MIGVEAVKMNANNDWTLTPSLRCLDMELYSYWLDHKRGIDNPAGRTESKSSGLVRSLSLSQAVMIGVASMIGGAIFVLVGPGIDAAGPALIIAFQRSHHSLLH